MQQFKNHDTTEQMGSYKLTHTGTLILNKTLFSRACLLTIRQPFHATRKGEKRLKMAEGMQALFCINCNVKRVMAC